MLLCQIMDRAGLEPGNIRIRKLTHDGGIVYEVLQASSKPDKGPRGIIGASSESKLGVVRGDHAKEMAKSTHSMALTL